MIIKNFRELCANAWKDKYKFLVMDLSRDDDKNKFRNKLDLLL
jgi:hypothetical protein